MSKKILSVILAIVVMASLCIVSASAAETANNLKTTTGKLHVGDTVEYTVSLKYGDDKLDKVAAINATVTYDKEVLKIEAPYADEDIKFPVLTSAAVFNADNPGELLFNHAAGTAGFNGFKDGGVLISVKFTVLKDTDGTDISFLTNELFNVKLGDDRKPIEAESNKAITTGCSAAAKVTCPHGDSDKVESDKDSDKVESDKDSDKVENDPTKAPPTGDVATVVMMLVFAAAAVAVIAKRREA